MSDMKNQKQAPKPALSLVEQWEKGGIPCRYVRFHQPIPPFEDSEPVSEFKQKATNKKYIVDSITYTEHGIIWRARGELNLCALANVMYARTSS